MTTYAYLRVSTTEQTSNNQRLRIDTSAFRIDEHISDDGVSGSTEAKTRPGFAYLMSKVVSGDAVVVTAVDRFGRSAEDVLNTINTFQRLGVKLYILQFDSIDVTSTMGKLVISIFSAVAEMERNTLIERTNAGLARTKAEGTVLGPPLTICPETMEAICTARANGSTLASISTQYGIPLNTVARNTAKYTGKIEEYATEFAIREAQYNASKLKVK
jgi:putative DNA-invertase from lambdoid prophage Rac